jgi:hypothetical protein
MTSNGGLGSVCKEGVVTGLKSLMGATQNLSVAGIRKENRNRKNAKHHDR